MGAAASTGRVHWSFVARQVVEPRVFLCIFWIATVCAAFQSSGLALTLATGWVIVTATLTALVLLVAEPLPRLRDRSHLLGRLIWVARFFTAALVLCLSTFIGAIAGAHVKVDDYGVHWDGMGDFLRSILATAGEIAVFLFFGWLVIDLWRMKRTHRVEAIDRLFLEAVGAPLKRMIQTPLVDRWMLTFTSPFVASVSLAVIAIHLLTVLPVGALSFG